MHRLMDLVHNHAPKLAGDALDALYAVGAFTLAGAAISLLKACAAAAAGF